MSQPRGPEPASHGPSPGPVDPPAYVMVVEDDATVADVLRDVLAGSPWEMVFVADGEEAIAASGVEVAVYLPLYRAVRQKIADAGGHLRDTGVGSSVWLGNFRVDGRRNFNNGRASGANAPGKVGTSAV